MGAVWQVEIDSVNWIACWLISEATGSLFVSKHFGTFI